MNARAWDATVPAELAQRMNEMLRATGNSDDSPDALLAAAIQGLETLVRQPAAQHTALDLLAVDGLVTAAFAGTHETSEIDALAGHAAARLMTLGNRSA